MLIEFNLYHVREDHSYSTKGAEMVDRVEIAPIVSLEEFTSRTKELIDDLPYLRSVIGQFDVFIFGGVLRTLAEGRDVKEYLANGGDVDIRICESMPIRICESMPFKQLIQQIVDGKGYVEYAGSGYEQTPGDFTDIDLSSRRSVYHFETGGYFMYVKYCGRWVKYDVTYGGSVNKVDFYANALRYPFLRGDNIKMMCALRDIKDRRLQFMDQSHTPKILYRARKMWEKGYRFEKTGHIQREYKYCIQSDMISDHTGKRRLTKTAMAYAGDTSCPSRSNGHHSFIGKTNHVITPIDITAIKNDANIQQMLLESAPDESNVHNALPDNGIGFGTTTEETIIFKAALTNIITVVSGVNRVKAQVVVVSLKIPSGTRFNRNWHGNVLKFRFEFADVEQFYSYPMKIVENDIEVYSSYESTFQYKRGERVHPTHAFDQETSEACSTGIHGFIDMEIAWKYLSKPLLLE